ncbi:MAG: SUF system Fe-S cluster assembly protein [Phycisphaerae bacterium]
MAEPTGDKESTPSLKERVEAALKSVFDPEIPVNIYELGLIYDLTVTDAGRVEVRMTLTSPACPVAGSLPGEVETKIRAIEGVADVRVELVWDPPWTPERMSDAAKLQLNMDLGTAPQPPGADPFQNLGRIP